MWIDRNFLRMDPYAFVSTDGNNLFPEFVHDAAQAFEVDPNGIYCIGSGAIGLSCNPKNVQEGHLKAFGASSDLDIAVISQFHFDQAWRDLRVLAHTAYTPSTSKTLRVNLDHQRARMFDGAIVANKLMTRLTFGPHWGPHRLRLQFEWRDRLSLSGKVNLWVYRDYWSVRSYVAEGIEKCLEKLRSFDDDSV
ncbi:hypothetical protein [Nocardioides acrostichi]|uniref:Uncharacterized protein n=1 Tax=Nocardioides acrostichi TaxID=2784339 RepID=A0A930Y7Z1_9ACTN|nr:hypothetical protein [Nocardioides acrostichi]MBF4162501.1 hypothetical protein [Nocardioides acrostichi]